MFRLFPIHAGKKVALAIVKIIRILLVRSFLPFLFQILPMLPSRFRNIPIPFLHVKPLRYPGIPVPDFLGSGVRSTGNVAMMAYRLAVFKGVEYSAMLVIEAVIDLD